MMNALSQKEPIAVNSLADIGYPISQEYIGYDHKLKINYVYDIHTRNLSFIQTAKDLSNLGVKNNKFFLKLYDPKLIGVDPYSTALTTEQIQRIIIEVIRNPWYYLREIARIPEQGSAQGPGSGTPFQLHRGNLAAIYCFLNNINLYLVIPRQCGKTQSMLAILNWTYMFGTTNSEFSFVNKSQKDANDNLARFKAQKELLPLYLQQRYIFTDGEMKPNRGKDNVQTLQNDINGNRVVTKPSARTLESAENVGRGNTSPIQLFDEVEFTSFIGVIMKASGPAFVQAARNALRNNAPFCRIFITTPGNIDSEPVESSKDTRNNATRWSDRLYDLSVTELYEYLKTNSRNRMFYIEYSYIQLGKGEDWYQAQCEALEFDKIRIKREIHLQRIRGSSESPFDEEDLDIINGLQKQCISEMLLNKIYSIRLYENLKPEIPYFVGIDISTGTNNDNTAMIIIDPYNERAVGEFKSPLMSVQDICSFIRLLVRKLIPKAVLCIERNSLGDAVIQLLKQTEVAPNLYFNKDNVTTNSTDKLDDHGFIKQEAENRRYYGVQTNIKSREIMMQILYRLVAEKKESFAVEYVISDLNNLIKKKSGKIEARSGEHDDCIMAFLIGMYVLYHGVRLYMWGFKRGSTPMDEDLKPMKYSDIYDEMSPEMKEMFPAPEPVKNPYEEKLREAILEAQRSRSNFSLSDNAVVTRNNDDDFDYTQYTEDDVYSDYDDDFFKDLNS